MYDYLIVGAGLFGSTLSNLLNAAGSSVLVLERRTHMAGNCYIENRNGINVHAYGAHIFHTNDSRVWSYVNRFADFNSYRHTVVADYNGQMYSMPFSMYTFNRIWGIKTPAEAENIIAAQRAEISGEPTNLEQQAISLVGRDIYERLVKGYTEKQWGRSCDELPPEIIRRLPVRLTWDNGYFNDPYQGVADYTEMVSNMLDGVEVELDTDYLDNPDYWNEQAQRIIYTGPIDEFYNCCYGHLSYRSLRFETEELDCPNYQGAAVVNYTDRETPFTRIIEHKWFDAANTTAHTIITREYPEEWSAGKEPYYPVNDAANQALYQKYAALAQRDPKILFGGRLGSYRYLNMDQVIAEAMALADKLLAFN